MLEAARQQLQQPGVSGVRLRELTFRQFAACTGFNRQRVRRRLGAGAWRTAGQRGVNKQLLDLRGKLDALMRKLVALQQVKHGLRSLCRVSVAGGLHWG